MSEFKPTQSRSQRMGYDPTENVIALVKASNKRMDDLRKSDRKLSKSENGRLAERVSAMESAVKTQEKHTAELRVAEAGRIDSIRQVDVSAVKTEADRALVAINALANTTAANADNLRNALTATAATIAKSTADTIGEITTRIAALEKAYYEGRGKEQVADPMMKEFIEEMRLVAKRSDDTTSKATVTDPQLTVLIEEVHNLRRARDEQTTKESLINPEMATFIAETRAFQAKQIAGGQEAAGKSKGISMVTGIAITAAGVVATGIGMFASLVWITSLGVTIYMAFHH